MKYPLLAGVMLAVTVPAYAQTAAPAPAATPAAAATATATPTVGAIVYDPQGGEVGKIDSVTDAGVVIDTGTNKVGVARAGIGAGAKGLTMATTKAELDKAYADSKAQAEAALLTKLTPGVAIKGTGGAEVAKVKTADAEFVTLTTAKGDVRLPIAAFAAQADGSIMIGMTAADFDKAVAASKAS